MKDLGKLEVATIRRTAFSVKSWRNKLAKIDAKIKVLQEEKEYIETTINMFEGPIKELTGGFTSEEVLKALDSPATTPEESTDSLVASETVESSIEDPLPFEIGI